MTNVYTCNERGGFPTLFFPILLPLRAKEVLSHPQWILFLALKSMSEKCKFSTSVKVKLQLLNAWGLTEVGLKPSVLYWLKTGTENISRIYQSFKNVRESECCLNTSQEEKKDTEFVHVSFYTFHIHNQFKTEQMEEWILFRASASKSKLFWQCLTGSSLLQLLLLKLCSQCVCGRA